MNVKNLEKSIEHSKIIQDLKKKPPSPIVVATIIVLAIVIFNAKTPPSVEHPDYGGEPEIQWLVGYGLIVHYQYTGVVLTGYTAYVRFENTGDSGELQLTASVRGIYGSLTTMTKTFYVEENKQYKLTIRASATEGYSVVPTYNYYTLMVSSPSADSPWTTSLGPFGPNFRTSIQTMSISQI